MRDFILSLLAGLALIAAMAVAEGPFIGDEGLEGFRVEGREHGK